MEAGVCTPNQSHVPDEHKPNKKPPYSHDEPARKLGFDRHLFPMLVHGLCYLVHGQHFRDQRPHGRVGKVFPRAHASTESVCELVDVVGFERTIVVEESLGHERVWVRVLGFVVCHGPSKVSHDPSRRSVKSTHQALVMRRAPARGHQYTLGHPKRSPKILPFGIWNPPYTSSSTVAVGIAA